MRSNLATKSGKQVSLLISLRRRPIAVATISFVERKALLWVHDITAPDATGAPITYMAGGKQYIAFPVGGGPIAEELIAVSL